MDISTIIISLAIAVTGGIIAGKYLFSSNRVSKLETEKASIEAGRLELKRRVENLMSELADCQTKLEQKTSEYEQAVTELQKKIAGYEDKNIILSMYNFDKTFGFWRHKNDPHDILCNVCINENLPTKAPLKFIDNYNYRCTRCEKPYYRDDPNEMPPENVDWRLC